MYRPYQKQVNETRIDVSTFGGLNRKARIGAGEFEDIHNFDSAEYPVLTTRKPYDRCVYNKFCLQWKNNDMYYTLYPAIPYEDYINSEVTKKFDDEDAMDDWIDENRNTNGCFYGIVGGKIVYRITIYNQVANRKAVKTYIMTQGFINTEIPDMITFKNPVCTNINTQTVINDEINGMWVVDTDTKSGNLSYYKVAQKFEVKNTLSGTIQTPPGTDLIDDTDVNSLICHMRFYFFDTKPVKGLTYAVGEEELIKKATNDRVDFLIAYGETVSALGSSWFRVKSNENVEKIDKITTKYFMRSAPKFKKGDYLYFDNHTAHENRINGPGYDRVDSFVRFNGWKSIDNVETFTDQQGVVTAHALIIEDYIPSYRIMSDISHVWEHKQSLNDIRYQNGDSRTLGMYLADGFSIERKAPENAGFMCTSCNRVWCTNGQNEIMCSTQGNPLVWYKYEGTSQDSYAVSIGGDGSFTGCIDYGYPLFFKANKMYRITGTKPSNYQTDEYTIKGVKKGCHDSLAIVNDVLYYQGADGIYQYSGSTPTRISDSIFAGNWSKGFACRYRDKYYFSVLEGEKRKLYCFDTQRGIWHEEKFASGEIVALVSSNLRHRDAEAMTIITRYDNPEKDIDTTFIEDNSGWGEPTLKPVGELSADEQEKEFMRRQFLYYAGYVVSSDDITRYSPEKTVEWDFTTGDLLLELTNHVYVKKVYMAIETNNTSSVKLLVEYDRNGLWKEIRLCKGDKKRLVRIPVDVSNRCDSFKIRAVGKGKAIIHSMYVEYEIGSEYK